jgi:hypothetical protein
VIYVLSDIAFYVVAAGFVAEEINAEGVAADMAYNITLAASKNLLLS